jgi:hypothetical protein
MTVKRIGTYLLIAAIVGALCTPCSGNEDRSADVPVALSRQKPLWLHVTVRSRAPTRVTFPKYLLPWGREHSIMIVAITPSERLIQRVYPVDDSGRERVSFEPNEQQGGEVNLQMKLAGLDSAVKKSEIHLFWAYEAPKELNIPRWSGGWVLIPQEK